MMDGEWNKAVGGAAPPPVRRCGGKKQAVSSLQATSQKRAGEVYFEENP